MPYLSQTELARRRDEARRARRRRRAAVGLAGVVAAAAAAIALVPTTGSPRSSAARHARALNAGITPAVRTTTRRSAPAGSQPLRILPPHPGTARVYLRGPAAGEVALTFDDGLCASCVARIVRTLARTGEHATIFPNGVYGASWDPVAPEIRRLVADGQLTIGNHTFLHHDAREESPDEFRADLDNDEQWIERTFHVSARPFFRPPYGAYDSETLAVAGELGYTKVIMWSGTVADSSPHTIGYILAAIRYWARPGAIILMHGNYPATSEALPQIFAILRRRHLRPVTLQQLLG